MDKIVGRADAYFNGEFLCIRTMSQGMLAYAEPGVDLHYLSTDSTDEEVGRVLRQALAATKLVTPTEFQAIYKSGVVEATNKARSAQAMATYGYKSKRAMYQNMACCWVKLAADCIEIVPTVHDSLDGYRGISKDGPEIMHLSAMAPDNVVGAALREGFRRCVSEWP